MRGRLVSSVVLVVLALAAGCRPPARDDGSGADAGSATDSLGGDPARGEYLVRTVGACGECHTPRDATGALDPARWLAGVPRRFDVAPDEAGIGAIGAPNLTPYALAAWTDVQIKRAMVDGIDRAGQPLYPLMPYYVFHNMTDDDAAAIVAYLRALPAVTNDVPLREPLPSPLVAPVSPLPEAAIPHTTLKTSDKNFARAEAGRYLAAMAGVCVDCHSPWREGGSPPLDTSMLFTGGRPFAAREWGGAPSPSIVYARNLTPDPSGLDGWTATDVQNAVKTATDKDKASLCRPMPSFDKLRDEDALAIGLYLTTLPAVPAPSPPECVPGP